jgi:hypothetical protein
VPQQDRQDRGVAQVLKGKQALEFLRHHVHLNVRACVLCV